MTEASQKTLYRIGVAVALMTCLLTVWTTLVRDDGTDGTNFMLIMAVFVGWFATGYQVVGMARTMLGVGVMQGLHGLLVATAPVTASLTDGPSRAILFNAVFAGLWLTSAVTFHLASRSDQAAA